MFERIVPLYDTVVSLFFGNYIHKSQIHFFNEIKPNSNILIIGGGSGKILYGLSKQKPNKVTYVELSAKMISIAKVNAKNTQITADFIHGNEENIPANISFDGIITPFVLDCYTVRRSSENY